MAKAQPNKPDKVAWKGFVTCELNAERKKQFKESWAGHDVSWLILDETVTPGYKISFSIDQYHNCAQVSWYCSDPKDQNAGWCLTARGPDFSTALSVLLFKHTVVLEGDWTSAAPLDASEDYLG